MASQVNSLTSAIAQLNQQIQSTSPDADAGTLEDQRQQDLSQLSQLIGINQITTENNGLSITTTSGQLLVCGGIEFPVDHGHGRWSHRLFSWGRRILPRSWPAGGGRTGRLSDGARPGHSQRALSRWINWPTTFRRR